MNGSTKHSDRLFSALSVTSIKIQVRQDKTVTEKKLHIDFNNSSEKRVESYNGKFWKSKGHSHLVKYLKRDRDKRVPYDTTTSFTSG